MRSCLSGYVDITMGTNISAKKAFTAYSRAARFAYLYTQPVQTRRLKIAALNNLDAPAFKKFLLKNVDSYAAYMGQGWAEYFKEYRTDDRMVSHLLIEEKKMRHNVVYLWLRKIGSPELLGNVSVYRDTHARTRVSYFLADDARGQGYAREAVKAVQDIVEKFERKRIRCAEPMPDNIASRNLLIDLGFTPMGLSYSTCGPDPDVKRLRMMR